MIVPASMTEVETRFEECFTDEAVETPSGSLERPSAESSGIRTRRPTGSSTHREGKPKRRTVAAAIATLGLIALGGTAFFLTHSQPNAVPPSETAAQKPAASREESSPVVRVTKPPEKPVEKPAPPPPVNDDRYVVVRAKTLKADDAAGKGKDPNSRGVLANDGLPADKPHEVECVEKPKFGELKLNRDGTFTYASTVRPGGEIVRGDSFKYRVRLSDKDPWSEPASVAIVIRPFAATKRRPSSASPRHTVRPRFAARRIRRRWKSTSAHRRPINGFATSR